MADGSKLPEEPLCLRLKRRLGHLKNDRASWEPHWRELSDHFAPRTGNWNNQDATTRGQKKNQKIINGTPLIAARTLSSGMMAGLTSPARPWFRLTTPDPALADFAAVKQWLSIVEMRIREVFAKSNLYRVLPTVYAELGVFGSHASVCLEDDEDTIRLQPWEMGTYWLAQDARLRVDTGYREIKMTVRQLVQEFGIDKCSARVQSMFRSGQWEQWIDVNQAIEPNDERLAGKGGARGMMIRSAYWEKGGDKDKLLAERGFRESALLAPRWGTQGSSVYGDSPAMDALGDAKALQFEEKRKAQSLDKLVDPPMTAPVSLRNSRVSLVAGDVTYVDVNQTQAGFRPVYEIKPDMQWQQASINEIEQRINSAMFADMFLMLTLDARSQPPTAEEIRAREQEKLTMLGPVLERLNDELLDPLIDRTFAIMLRRSQPFWNGTIDGNPVLPPPPDELKGTDLKIEYISILSQAQKLAGIQSVERFVAFTGNLAAAKGDLGVFDKVNTSALMDGYADMIGLPPQMVRPDEEVDQIQADRAQQQQAAQTAAMAPALNDASAAVKNLGTTPVNGDTTALDQLLAMGGGPR